MLGFLLICFLVGLFVVMLFTEGGRAFLGGLFAITAIGLGIILLGAIVIGAIVFLIAGAMS